MDLKELIRISILLDHDYVLILLYRIRCFHNYRLLIMKESVIVTGAAGFIGYHLTKTLVDKGFSVYAVVRPGSNSNSRIRNLSGVDLLECNINMDSFENFSSLFYEKSDYFFHLAWEPADRYDYSRQMQTA